jgi:hypothetical protein
MSEIVNLRRAKKARERAAKEKDADANRARFGTPKLERSITKARSHKDAAELEGKKLDPDKELER